MFILRVDFLAVSLPRIQGHVLEMLLDEALELGGVLLLPIECDSLGDLKSMLSSSIVVDSCPLAGRSCLSFFFIFFEGT